MKGVFGFACVGGMMAILACLIGTPGSYEFYRLKTHGYVREQETEAVKSAIKLFSSTVAGFYGSGGYVSGLNIFPGDKPLKRRFFQEILISQQAGRLYVLDRDISKVKQVLFVSPDHAVAVVNENWYGVWQDAKSRRPVSAKQANIITVRYYLKKMWSRWIIIEYEVHKQDEMLPPALIERFTTW